MEKEFACLFTTFGIDMQAIQELAKYKHNDEIPYLQFKIRAFTLYEKINTWIQA